MDQLSGDDARRYRLTLSEIARCVADFDLLKILQEVLQIMEPWSLRLYVSHGFD